MFAENPGSACKKHEAAEYAVLSSSFPEKSGSDAEPLCPRLQGHRRCKRAFFRKRRSNGEILSPANFVCEASILELAPTW